MNNGRCYSFNFILTMLMLTPPLSLKTFVPLFSKSPRRSSHTSPWDSPSATLKEPRPAKRPVEPQYKTSEGFFHQVSQILRRMTNSNRTESSSQGKISNYQEEHIYETVERVQVRVPLSPATWMKKKLQHSASQGNKKNLYVKTVERSIRRTPSMDCLDDRMLRTTHLFLVHPSFRN